MVLAGRDAAAAERAAAELNRQVDGGRAIGIRVDASNARSLETAFRQCNLVVVCMPYRGHARLVLETAVAAGIDYIDINGDSGKHRILQELSRVITTAGLTYLVEGGEVPGLPSALALLAGRHFEHVNEIAIGSLWKDPEMPVGSVFDIMSHLSGDNPPFLYREGSWRPTRMVASRRIDFGPPFGERNCFPIDLPEMREIPRLIEVDHIGTYQAGINWFVDGLALAWTLLGLGKSNEGLQRGIHLFRRGNRLLTKKPFGMAVALDAIGAREGKTTRLRMRVTHDDLYAATGIAAAAFVVQMIDGTIGRPGVLFAGHACDGDRLLEDCRSMGMNLTTSCS